MIREISDHQVGTLGEAITVQSTDMPGSGGAYHDYEIQVKDAPAATKIHFQKGPLKEAGLNGITDESLMAIVIDRLRCFQAGPFPCRENALALTKLEESLLWLQKRTRDRMGRGVEGTLQK